jgi:hypothetical protein
VALLQSWSRSKNLNNMREGGAEWLPLLLLDQPLALAVEAQTAGIAGFRI